MLLEGRPVPWHNGTVSDTMASPSLTLALIARTLHSAIREGKIASTVDTYSVHTYIHRSCSAPFTIKKIDQRCISVSVQK